MFNVEGGEDGWRGTGDSPSFLLSPPGSRQNFKQIGPAPIPPQYLRLQFLYLVLSVKCMKKEGVKTAI